MATANQYKVVVGAGGTGEDFEQPEEVVPDLREVTTVPKEEEPTPTRWQVLSLACQRRMLNVGAIREFEEALARAAGTPLDDE